MYLQSFRGLSESVEDFDWGTVPDYPAPSLPSPSDTGPTQSTDWINLLKGAVKTYGDIERSRTQSAALMPQAPQIVPTSAVPSGAYPWRVQPLSSPFSGLLGNGGTLLLLGSAAVALALALK